MADVGRPHLQIKRKETLRRQLKCKGDCVVCGESRAVETCHIIPVCICKIVNELNYLVNSLDNCVRLCKNHHWMFDNNLLTDEELEKIYKNKKTFIDKELLYLINSEIKPEPNKVILKRDEINVSKLNKWLLGVASVFFVKK